MKPVQYFTPEYLEQCRRMTPDQVIRFVEDFRVLHAGRVAGSRSRSRLISLKVPEDLLELFKTRAQLAGRRPVPLTRFIAFWCNLFDPKGPGHVLRWIEASALERERAGKPWK